MVLTLGTAPLKDYLGNQLPIPTTNTVVHDNICGTKCNKNNWSYPGHGAKFDTKVVTVLLLWVYPVTAPNAFPGSLFINPLWAQVVLKR